MISHTSARALRDAGLQWHPGSGDAFCIDKPEFESDVFTISDMTIEPHVFDTGTVLGFNGTTEWALDSVALEHALWLPREAQLRELLGGTFQSLTRSDGGYRVSIVFSGQPTGYESTDDPADAYALALLALMEAAR